MPGWFWVLFWWLCFAGSHLVLSSAGLRSRLIDRLGSKAFMGLYSLIAFATFIPLIIAYFSDKHAGVLLWNLRAVPGMTILAILVAAVAWVVIVASYWQPSPLSLVPGAAREARGLTRITRHPLFMGIALWGLSHLILNGFLSDIIFFGGFVIYALIGAAHQDSRQRSRPELTAFYGSTSLLPFAAILQGRNRLILAELPWLGLGVGLGVAALLYAAHYWL